MKDNIAIIIVNWNGRQFLDVCLSSLKKQTYKFFKIIFVDNGSTDKSVDFVRKNFPKVEIIENKKNLGFAEGNNIGIRKALKDTDIKYIVTLNNDTKVDEEWLERLVIAAKTSNDSYGSFQGKVLNFKNPKIIDGIGVKFDRALSAIQIGYNKKDKGQYKQGEVLGVCAGAALYKRKLLESIRENDEFFDKKFFAYLEDVDLLLRARLKGWKALFVEKSIVYHIGSATGKSHSSFKLFLLGRNRCFYIVKNIPFRIILSHSPFMLMNYIRVFMLYLHKKNFNIALSYLKGGLFSLGTIPTMLKKRSKIFSQKKVDVNEINKWFNK